MGVRVREKIRGSGEWWIFISHRRKRASKKIGTRKAAKEAATKIEREIALERFNLETPEEMKPLLFRKYAERWMKQHAEVNCKPATVLNYRYALDVNLLPALGDKDIREITRDDVKALCFEMKQKGLSPGVVKLRGTILGGIFNAAIEDGLLVGNPAIRLGKIVKVPSRKGRVDFLNQDESRKLLDTVQEHFPRWLPFFLTALRTGMRVGELIALQWEDIDWNGKFIEVRRAISRGVVGTPKNGKPRRIDLSDRLSAVLTDHRKGMAKEALAQGRSMPERVFVNPEGGELQASSVVKPYRRILTKAGLRRLRFHDLRHSFASALLANGEPLSYVKEQMGHSSIQITVDVYGHLEPGANREAVNRLDDPEWKIQGRKTRETAPPVHPEGIARQGNANELAEIIGDSGIITGKVGLYHESQACAAGGAPVPGQASGVDPVPLPADDGRAALRANRIFRPRQMHVPYVDMREPLPGDAIRRGQPVGRRRRGGCAVLRIVARDVERDLPVRIRHEVDHLPNLRFRIVVPRVEKRGELDVGRLRGRPDRREDRVEIPPADLPVEGGVHRSQVDVHRVHEGKELGQRFRTNVPVGDQDVPHPRRPERLGAFEDVFELDQRLVVGVGDPDRILPARRSEQILDPHRFDRDPAQDELPVLAELAPEVAPDGTDGEDARAGVKVEERFLLDGVHRDGGDLPVRGGDERPAPVLADPADPGLPLRDTAPVGAEHAPHGVPFRSPVRGDLVSSGFRRHETVPPPDARRRCNRSRRNRAARSA